MEAEGIIRQIAISAVPILFAVVFHELSHGLAAYKLGDPTAKMLGRLTLNPIAHLDIIGTVIMPITLYVMTNGQFVFGYAKPVPINPMNFRNPRRDMALSAAAGPVSNILVATVSMLLLKYVAIPIGVFSPEWFDKQVIEPISLMLQASIIVNTVLAVFNMFPLPPLDGGRVVAGFLPTRYAQIYDRIEPFGMIIVLVLVVTGMTSYFIYPLVRVVLNLLKML